VKKSLLILILILFSSGFIANRAAAQTPTVKIDTVLADNLSYGAEINMPVMAYDLYNVGSVGIWLSFDSNVLTYVAVNNINSQMSSSCTYNYDGTYIKFGWYQIGSSGINLNNTVLFNIKFTYKSNSTKLSFYKKKCSFGDFTTLQPITVTYFDGMVLNKPAAFSLSLPFNNVYVSNLPYFQWNASSGAGYYKIYVDNQLYKSAISATSYHVTANDPLLSDGHHSWHVVACNKLGTIISNETWNIIVGDPVAKGFSLISPANNANINNACSQIFTWHAYGDAQSSPSRYVFYMNGFDPVTLGPSDTSVVFPYTIPYGSNSWYVKVYDEYDNEVVSATRNFSLQETKIFSVNGYLTYNNTSNSALRGVKIYLKNTLNVTLDSTVTNNSGYFQFSNLANGKYKLLASTDKNPGGMDLADALMINKYYIKLYNTSDTLKITSADVTSNKKVSPDDAFAINRFYIKLINSFPAGKWVFAKPVFVIDCENTSVNFKGICVGDFNASYNPD
jgi:hypothetical protein